MTDLNAWHEEELLKARRQGWSEGWIARGQYVQGTITEGNPYNKEQRT